MHTSSHKSDASPRKQWEDLAKKALKSDDLSRLSRITEDGITIAPLYLAEDRPDAISNTLSAQASQDWQMLQFIEPQTNSADLNRAILEELEGGASGVIIHPDQETAMLTKAMDGVYLNAISLAFHAPKDPIMAANHLLQIWQDHNIAPIEAKGSIGFDGLAYELADGGAINQDFDAKTFGATYGARLKTLMDQAASWPHLGVVGVGGLKWHNLGLTPAGQIAVTMAEILMILRQAENQGIALETMVNAMRFGLVFDADLYQGLAKARAFRLVLDQLLSAMGVEGGNRSHQCHGFTAEQMLSRLDTDTNILRNGTAVLAASLSGLGMLTVMPHDWLTGSSDQGRKVARNMHHLLADEGQLGQVADPAQGSYFMDHLTAQLAEKSWAMMQDIETAGGLEKALSSGKITAMAADAVAMRQARINQGQTASLGVTLHPIKGASLEPVISGVLGKRGGACRVTENWEDLYQAFADQSLRCLLLDIGVSDGKPSPLSAAQFSRWFAAAGLDATMMTAEDLTQGQSIISSAKPDILILGGRLAAQLADDPLMDQLKPSFVMVCAPTTEGDYFAVMQSIAASTCHAPEPVIPRMREGLDE